LQAEMAGSMSLGWSWDPEEFRDLHDPFHLPYNW
jgi:hypothetical protein